MLGLNDIDTLREEIKVNLFAGMQKQIDDLHSEGTKRDHAFANLFSKLAIVKAQLESTEKSYDESLQENLKLQEQIKLLTLGESYGMGATRKKFFADEIKAFKIPKSRDLNEITVPVIPIDPVAEDVADDLFAEAREKNRMGVLIIDDDVERLIDEDAERHRLKSEALKTIPDLAQQSERALGDRAKMKDTLGRTQNACRRYKARIKRQKAQLEALQDLANAAFPLYSALTKALADEKIETPFGEDFALIHLSGALEQQCDDFHNKFNNAAEELANVRQ
jgi:hypothetical protein